MDQGPAAVRGDRLRTAAFVLATGAISWAWSEVAFWAMFRPDDGVGTWLLTWLLYTVVAYLVLRLLRCYPSAALAPLFLAGSVYGWLVEGTLATTLYLELPFSVVWTGVAWHGLLTVVVGWRWLPSALRHGGRKAWSWCAVVGLAWGVWGACWWGAPPEEEPLATTPEPVSYAIFVTLISIIAAVSYGIMNATAPTPRDLSSRWTLWTAIAVLAAWAGLTFFWALPWAPAVLAPLVVLGAVGMRKASVGPVYGSVLGWAPGVPWRKLPPLSAIPVVAIAIYCSLIPVSSSALFQAGFVGYVLLLSVVGSVLLIWSLWTTLKRPKITRPAP